MQILKRTQGIDFKANNSHLEGRATLILTDAKSGKVVERVEHKNFFTNALDSVLNGCPWGLDKVELLGGNVAYNVGGYRFGDLYDTLLGGVLLFPDDLGNGLDDYYPPFDSNYPTAYASNAAYTLDDPKQGSFNKVLSGVVGNGYKYVYDWSTSNGNGTIAALALSHKNCYKYFNDGAIRYYPVVTSQTGGASGYNFQISGNNSERIPLAACDDGILTDDAPTSSDGRICRFYKVAPYDFQLIAVIGGEIPEVIDEYNNPPPYLAWTGDYTSYLSSSADTQFQFDNGTLYGYCKSSTGSSGLELITIDISDGSVLSSTTLTFAAPDATNSRRGFAIKDGYIYMGATVAGKVYKCNLSNVLDVTEISCNATANESLSACEGSDNIYGKNIIINNGVANPNNYTNGDPNLYFDSNLDKRYIYENGVWVVSCTDRAYIGAQIKAPYCATKNNITPVTKNSSQNMQVQYTVNQV